MSCLVKTKIITVGARGSPLSRAQVEEVLAEIKAVHPDVVFEPIWRTTSGDRDLLTSLRTMDRTNFFTKEIDEMQLAGGCRLSVHSAKDLPEPLPKGLVMVALTRGVDPSDVVVFRDGETLHDLPKGARVGTSSARREQNIQAVRSDLRCGDIRGSVGERLAQLDHGVFDGVIMAEAALIRLKLTHRSRIPLPGECAAMQGQLAVLARAGDQEMIDLFRSIDTRPYCARS